jgi:hypothetical protein
MSSDALWYRSSGSRASSIMVTEFISSVNSGFASLGERNWLWTCLIAILMGSRRRGGTRLVSIS